MALFLVFSSVCTPFRGGNQDLEAEELVFALITMCPVGISLRLGFGKGPGGTESGAHAALMGLSFHKSQEKMVKRRRR